MMFTERNIYWLICTFNEEGILNKTASSMIILVLLLVCTAALSVKVARAVLYRA
jgi:hypothetical protein